MTTRYAIDSIPGKIMKTLKTKLYHGTGCENVESISRDGLKISNKESPWPEESEGRTDYRKLAPTGVYLTTSIDNALYFGKEASRGGNACVFEVSCIVDGARIGSDGWGDKMTDMPVPPSCVRLLPREEIASNLSMEIDDLEKYIDELN